jgi:plastocyanin
MTTCPIHAAAARRTAAFLLAGSLIAFGLRAGAVEPSSIAIEKFAFVPKEVTVPPGTTVVWTNHDETPHTVSSPANGFTSKAMDTDDRFEHTFASEGDFSYFCTLHPFMTGIVHVRK